MNLHDKFWSPGSLEVLNLDEKQTEASFTEFTRRHEINATPPTFRTAEREQSTNQKLV